MRLIFFIAMGIGFFAEGAPTSRRLDTRRVHHDSTSPKNGKVTVPQVGRVGLEKEIAFADAPRTRGGVDNVTREQQSFQVNERTSPHLISMRESMVHKGSTTTLTRDSYLSFDVDGNPSTIGSQIDGSFGPKDKQSTIAAFVSRDVEGVTTREHGYQLVPREKPDNWEKGKMRVHLIPDKSKPDNFYEANVFTEGTVKNVRVDFLDGGNYSVTVHHSNGTDTYIVKLETYSDGKSIRMHKIPPHPHDKPFVSTPAKETTRTPIDADADTGGRATGR